MKCCRVCGVELTSENWYPNQQLGRNYICKKCNVLKIKEWRKNNRDKARLQSERGNRKRGLRPMSENKECSIFLGVHVAEQVLKKVFKDVEVMPTGNPGYDFICNKGKKIDVKSACARLRDSRTPRWEFMIRNNKIADYFLCLAFDNRDDLNPQHIWLLPCEKFNNLSCPGISLGVIRRWDEYKLDITKVINCCNVLCERG